MKQKQINQNWKEFELGEITEVKKGTSITKKTVTTGNVPVIAGGQQPAYYHNHSNREGETITISGSGAYAGFVAYFQQPIFASDCSTIQVNNKNILTRYIYSYLKGNQNKIYNLQKGIAQPHVYPKDIQKINISFPILKDGTPDLEKQKKIVAILEKAEGLKDKRKELDELFDEYLKSVFWEMFLKEDFEKEKLDDICEITSSKRIYQNEYVMDGIPFYRSKEVIELNNNKDISIELFISNSKYSELKQKFGVPKKGDILITAVGTIGKTYVVPNNREFYFKDGNLLWIRSIKNVIPIYLDYFLSNHFKKNKNDLSSGSAYNALTIIKLKQFKIPLPPLALQEKFASIVERVEKIKDKLKDEKRDSEELFDVLMSRAFSGELI